MQQPKTNQKQMAETGADYFEKFLSGMDSNITLLRAELKKLSEDVHSIKIELAANGSLKNTFEGNFKTLAGQMEILSKRIEVIETDISKTKAQVNLVKGIFAVLVAVVTILVAYFRSK